MFGKRWLMARTLMAALAAGVTTIGGTQAVQATVAQAQQAQQGVSKEMATTELQRRRVDAMVMRKKGKPPRMFAPSKEPIWVGAMRLKRNPELGTVDSEREARRAVWRGVRRQYPGLSGRQFVKARKEAQRAA